jgi:hypothetical protein
VSTIPAVENRTARAITDGLEPKNVIFAVCLVLGAAQDDMLVGLAWAIHAIVFAAVIPAYIKYGIRSGRWNDRHVGQRERRLHLIPVIMTSVGIAIGAMVLLDAPTQMTALVVAMLATLAAILPVTAFWKISVHTSVAAGPSRCWLSGSAPGGRRPFRWSLSSAGRGSLCETTHSARWWPARCSASLPLAVSSCG